MAATVVISEFNTAGATESANISNSNYGSSDAANLTAASNPIAPGANSFEKWQKVKVTAMGGSTSIGTLKFWQTGTLSGSDTSTTNARTSSYGGAATFATPTASASSVATQTTPTSEPGGANLGIAGSLSGTLTGTGTSDYLVSQIHVHAATVAGASLTNHYQYNEVA